MASRGRARERVIRNKKKVNARSQTDDPALPESRVVREKTPKGPVLLPKNGVATLAATGQRKPRRRGPSHRATRSETLQYASDHVVCGVIATGNSFCSGAVWMGRPCDRWRDRVKLESLSTYAACSLRESWLTWGSCQKWITMNYCKKNWSRIELDIF